MKAEISRVAKKIYTYKDLCNLLHLACEYRNFNIVGIAGLIAKANNLFSIDCTDELKPNEYRNYTNKFLNMLYEKYSEKTKEFLHDYLRLRDKALKK
jgi:hypothetical protein|nr:MAG TPA: hypothetical protein [Caudoviricetes sp.]